MRVRGWQKEALQMWSVCTIIVLGKQNHSSRKWAGISGAMTVYSVSDKSQKLPKRVIWKPWHSLEISQIPTGNISNRFRSFSLTEEHTRGLSLKTFSRCTERDMSWILNTVRDQQGVWKGVLSQQGSRGGGLRGLKTKRSKQTRAFISHQGYLARVITACLVVQRPQVKLTNAILEGQIITNLNREKRGLAVCWK